VTRCTRAFPQPTRGAGRVRHCNVAEESQKTIPDHFKYTHVLGWPPYEKHNCGFCHGKMPDPPWQDWQNPLAEYVWQNSGIMTTALREIICNISFPSVLMLAFVFPGIGVGTQGSANCVCCEDVACGIVSFFSGIGDVHFFCCSFKAFGKCSSTRTTGSSTTSYPSNKQFAQLCILFFLLCDFVHVSGVGVP
jgi:hypothetical protein